MYFNYSGVWTGGHDVMGATSPQTSFYFAEGYTGAGFDEWLCLHEPRTPTATTAHITYMFADGTTQVQDVPIGATTRATVNVNAAGGPGQGRLGQDDLRRPHRGRAPHVLQLQRRLDRGTRRHGRHLPPDHLLLRRGLHRSRTFDEWLCLMNPEPTATTAHITYMFTDGTTQAQDVPIGATTRATVNVNDAGGRRTRTSR